MDDALFLDPPVLEDATIPELPGHYRGKVRDNYDLPHGRRILIATDRLSAFDRILAAIPYKGQVLTQTARFWFERDVPAGNRFHGADRFSGRCRLSRCRSRARLAAARSSQIFARCERATSTAC